MKKKRKQKGCQWFRDDFCCKDLDSGRVWDCTAPNLKERKRMDAKGLANIQCPYPKLGKD